MLLCLLAADSCRRRRRRRRVEVGSVGSSMVTRGQGSTANLG